MAEAHGEWLGGLEVPLLEDRRTKRTSLRLAARLVGGARGSSEDVSEGSRLFPRWAGSQPPRAAQVKLSRPPAP